MLSRNYITAAAAVLFPVMMNHAQAQFQSGEFISYSQESWGSYPPPSNAAQLLIDRFMEFYGGGIEIGFSGNDGFSIIFTSAGRVLNYLPSSGSPSALNKDELDPNSTSSGLFGGFVLALQLNVDFNDAGYLTGTAGIPFGDLILVDLPFSPEFNGFTIRKFLAQINRRLGDDPPYTYDDVAATTDDVTRAFEGGIPTQFAQEHLRIAIPGDYNLNGIVDAADYTIWRDTLGSTTDLRANGDNTGTSANVVDQADFIFWKTHFGVPPGSGSGGNANAAAPEPTTLAMLLVGTLAMFAHRRPDVS